MIKIYGSPRSSSGRCYLMLEEVAQPYEAVPLDMMEKKEHKSEAFLKLNPNGKVPCLIDDKLVIWESMAINFYLADKYKPELMGKTPADRGLALQWSLWGLNELQSPMVDILIQTMFVPEPKRDHSVIKKAQEKIPQLLSILDHALEGRKYLVGDHFSVADLNVASAVNITHTVKISLENYKNILAWFEPILQRPSFQKYASMRNP